MKFKLPLGMWTMAGSMGFGTSTRMAYGEDASTPGGWVGELVASIGGGVAGGKDGTSRDNAGKLVVDNVSGRLVQSRSADGKAGGKAAFVG